MAFSLPLQLPAGVNDAGAGQVKAEVADVSNSGWTPSSGTDLWAMLDEESPNDADYITSSIGATTDIVVTRLASINTVTAGSGDTRLLYRTGKVDIAGDYQTSGPVVSLKVELLSPSGDALVPPIERTDVLGLLTDYTLTIPSGTTLSGQHLVRRTKSVS